MQNIQKIIDKFTVLKLTELFALKNLDDLQRENASEWDIEDEIQKEEKQRQFARTQLDAVAECLELLYQDMDQLHNYELFLTSVFYNKVPGLHCLKNEPVELWNAFVNHD